MPGTKKIAKVMAIVTVLSGGRGRLDPYCQRARNENMEVIIRSIVTFGTSLELRPE